MEMKKTKLYVETQIKKKHLVPVESIQTSRLLLLFFQPIENILFF